MLGADLRALRRARGLTLSDLARRLGRSVGWLSQVERALSRPSTDDLRRLAHELGAGLPMLCPPVAEDGEEVGLVVRKDARRPIKRNRPGLTEELLSPDLTDDFEVVHATFAPGSRLARPVTRPTQELAFMVSGRLKIEIGGRGFTVGSGDSFRIRGVPFRWSNPYRQPAVAIWVIAPPVY